MTRSEVSILSPLPKPKNFERQIKKDYLFDTIWRWIDPKLFYNKLLGYKGNFINAFEKGEVKSLQLFNDIKIVKSIVKNSKTGLMTPKSIMQFFQCEKKKDEITIFGAQDSERTNNEKKYQKLVFSRQSKAPFLSLSDYIHPEGDTLALFVVTCGEEVIDYSSRLRTEGQYKSSFILQALALASAEALAEIVHKTIRDQWGISEPSDLSIFDIIKGKYRGQRYSFGYPACPNLEDQKVIWNLLEPENIDLELTDGFMMDPEASVSAIVFHHPEARYFKV